MRKYLLVILTIVFLLLTTAIYLDNRKQGTSVDLPIFEIYPDIIYQGDPVFIRINASSTPKQVLFNKKEIKTAKYNNSFIGLIGIDLKETKKEHLINIELMNGMKFDKPIVLTMKVKEERPLGIPDSLGGNTKEAGTNLLNNITKENASINSIKLDSISHWSNSKFSKPLETIFVTDEYGYSRNTVGYSLAHKGTDFRALVGTPVMSINKGIVRISRLYILSGNTVVVDHGSGLVSIYMHLSKLNVKEGDEIESGQIIGLSGKTGYVTGAHLHLGIKINGISIDPAKFLKYFNVI